MGLLDGGQKNDLPPLSWEPVLDRSGDGDQPSEASEAGGASEAPREVSTDDASGIGPIHLEIPALGTSERSDGDQLPLVGSSADRPIGTPEPLPLPAEDAPRPDLGVSFSIPDLHAELTGDAPTGGAVIDDAGASSSSAGPSADDGPPPMPTAPPPVSLGAPIPVPAEGAGPVSPPVEPEPTSPGWDAPESTASASVPSPDVPEATTAPSGSIESAETTDRSSESAETADHGSTAPGSTAPGSTASAPVTSVDVSETSRSAAVVANESVVDRSPEVAAPDAAPPPPPPPAPPSAPDPATSSPDVSAPLVAAPSVPAASAPVVPAVAPPIQAPVQHLAPASLHSQRPAPSGPSRRATGAGRRVVSFMFLLILLAAGVAAGVIFGRPYLFPDQWDADVKPYAQAVEEALAIEFEEPVTVVAEESAQFEMRRSIHLLGDWESELPTWRALALANGQVDQASIDMLLDGRSPAIYSVADGRVYHDAALTGSTLDAHLTVAMAEVALDQRLRWSADIEGPSLDGAALLRAHVLQQARAAQRATEFDGDIVDPELTALSFLPPVLDYRVTGPEMYAELLPAPDGSTNPLAVPGGPGPLPNDEPSAATAPLLADGEVAIGEGTPRDRSFWYLVFAAYLDAPQSYAASQAIVDNTLTVTDRAGRVCVVATFSGGDADRAATVVGALSAWVASAPLELGATTSPIDGGAQLSTCDPGVGFENGARFGVARELIGYRLGAIATLTELGPGASATDVQTALDAYDRSGVGPALASLPFDVRPADAAAAAREAIAGSSAAGADVDAGAVTLDGVEASVGGEPVAEPGG